TAGVPSATARSSSGTRTRSRGTAGEDLGRLHRSRPPAGPAPDHRAPGGGGTRGAGHGAGVRADPRRAGAPADSLPVGRPPRRAIDGPEGGCGGAPQPRAGTLGAAAALPPRAGARVGG